MWRRWWRSYQEEGCSASEHNSRLYFNFCETTGYFEETSGCFPVVYEVTKAGYLLTRCHDISSCVCDDQDRYLKLKRDVFLTQTKWFLCLNPARDTYIFIKKIEIENGYKKLERCNISVLSMSHTTFTLWANFRLAGGGDGGGVTVRWDSCRARGHRSNTVFQHV